MDTPLFAGLTGIDLSVLAALAVVLGAVLRVVRKVWPSLRKFTHFIDDLIGEPERPGVPGRPGVMARLAGIEAHGQQTDRRLDGIEYQLKPNSGSSFYDKVTRVADTADRIEKTVKESM